MTKIKYKFLDHEDTKIAYKFLEHSEDAIENSSCKVNETSVKYMFLESQDKLAEE